MKYNVPLFSDHTLNIFKNNKSNVVIKLNLIYIYLRVAFTTGDLPDVR